MTKDFFPCQNTKSVLHLKFFFFFSFNRQQLPVGRPISDIVYVLINTIKRREPVRQCPDDNYYTFVCPLHRKLSLTRDVWDFRFAASSLPRLCDDYPPVRVKRYQHIASVQKNYIGIFFVEMLNFFLFKKKKKLAQEKTWKFINHRLRLQLSLAAEKLTRVKKVWTERFFCMLQEAFKEKFL